MFPPIFQVCAADATVTGLLGATPTRLYLFSQAPQEPVLPYAVWQLISGSPYNHLTCPPDADIFTVQVDSYATTATEARQVAEALRDAIQASAMVVSWNGESRDAETQNYRYSFDVEWHVLR